jgi:hypothetical protein
MAFSKSSISRQQESESLIEMPGEPAASLSGILKAGLFDQAQDWMMECRKISSGCPDRQASGIFSQGDVPAIVQAGLNQPERIRGFSAP